jgi:hypothetical protein
MQTSLSRQRARTGDYARVLSLLRAETFWSLVSLDAVAQIAQHNKQLIYASQTNLPA